MVARATKHRRCRTNEVQPPPHRRRPSPLRASPVGASTCVGIEVAHFPGARADDKAALMLVQHSANAISNRVRAGPTVAPTNGSWKRVCRSGWAARRRGRNPGIRTAGSGTRRRPVVTQTGSRHTERSSCSSYRRLCSQDLLRSPPTVREPDRGPDQGGRRHAHGDGLEQCWGDDSAPRPTRVRAAMQSARRA